MGLKADLEEKVNGDVILIDTSVITPHENTQFATLLYEGLACFETLDLELITRRFERLQELSRLIDAQEVITIPQVCTEIRYHLKTLNDRQLHLTSELREYIQEYPDDEIQYYRSVLDCITSYNVALFRFIKKLQACSKTPGTYDEQAKYNDFMDIAREKSFDLMLDKRRAKEERGGRVNLGEKLETDRHLVATAFVRAYTQPVTLLTRDNGIEILTGRVYEELIHDNVPLSPHASKFSIPEHTINVHIASEKKDTRASSVKIQKSSVVNSKKNSNP